MLRTEREREQRRDSAVVDPEEETCEADAAHAAVDYYNAVDNLINNTISADSQAFVQQVEQENGQ